ncbi:ATP-binding cassette domain-containing protein [Actinoallomurus spadix]|uniref:ABC-F family ATP-binding cassette domain-containing protein n=1 Tax=Actinoallomurus spadix TaxID=79912 RepID=A0ABN0WPA2_9ACTN|nr:ABC-F family ATP-binding cassette domain-containing protein [Actinoallomurus spadix]MCO5984784.1 ATP-binding cassette domain-containing protein [Actinoallomurus spadix]
MSTQLTLRNVAKSYGDHRVLDDVSFSVRPGERAGLVGENGSGKSTLLRLMAGVEAPDDGDVTVMADGGAGHLGQTRIVPPGDTVQQAIDAALADLRAVERRMRELEADLTEDRFAEYAALRASYEARGGYEADARVDKAIHGLGLAHVERDRPLGTLSGGEEARLALACVLAASPEILLLDEPTNHLDEPAMTWLEDRLRAHHGTVVVVSHDRLFLDRVATVIYEVEDGAVTRFGGGYSGFLAAKAAARVRWEQAYAAWCEEVERVETHAATTARRVAPGRPMKDRNKPAYDRDAGRVQSSVAGRVRQAQERLRQLRANPVPRPPDPLRFDGLFGGGAGEGTLAELREATVGDRLRGVSLTVTAGDHLLVHGPNGAGKSTLLRVLAGEEPDSGTVLRRGRVGYLPQEVGFADPRRSALAVFADSRPGHPDEHRERLLAYGLFRPEALDTPVGGLSVGQRRRLALARLLAAEHDLLLLDEPTNHLSLVLVEELETALADYRGALVVVSHDRTLRDRFPGARLEMREGRIAG